MQTEDDETANTADLISEVMTIINRQSSRLRLDIPTILAIQAAVDNVKCGHGRVVLDITQHRFSKIEWSESYLFPQEKKRRA